MKRSDSENHKAHFSDRALYLAMNQSQTNCSFLCTAIVVKSCYMYVHFLEWLQILESQLMFQRIVSLWLNRFAKSKRSISGTMSRCRILGVGEIQPSGRLSSERCLYPAPQGHFVSLNIAKCPNSSSKPKRIHDGSSLFVPSGFPSGLTGSSICRSNQSGPLWKPT